MIHITKKQGIEQRVSGSHRYDGASILQNGHRSRGGEWLCYGGSGGASGQGPPYAEKIPPTRERGCSTMTKREGRKEKKARDDLS